MVSEKQNPNPEDMQQAIRVMQMQMRMRNNALRHIDRIGPRTLRILQDLDLFGDEVISIGDEVEIAVLRDPEHVCREKLSNGPLLLYKTDKEKPERMAVGFLTFLFSEIREVREASFQHIERMAQADPLSITPRTMGVLETSRSALMSDAPEKWRMAAVAIHDALHDDVLVALCGIRQSLECEPIIQDGLNFYTPKVLYPMISSLDSIKLATKNPEKDHASITDVINGIVAEADNVSDLCSGYYKKLGFLPFAPKYSMAEVVNSWVNSDTSINVWEEVWKWADAIHSPVPRYHACSVFVLHPQFIPEGKIPDLWKEILKVVHKLADQSAESKDIEYEKWELRRDFAWHYAYHLEARLPDRDSASIGCFAWWFAEQVAMLFPEDHESIQFYREKWAKPALDFSRDIWLTASSPIQHSFLRYVTFTIPLPWAVALLAIMGEHMEKLVLDEQAQEIQTQFYEALVSNIICFLPFPIESPSDPTFALECSMAETVLKCSKHQSEEYRKALEQFVETSRKLSDADALCTSVRKLSESSLDDQFIIALALKARAYTDPEIAAGIWDIVSDAEWREKVLAGLETQVQGILIEVLSILMIDNREKWFSLLPHYLAEICEKEEDKERRRFLFLHVIHTSLASDTVSAVQRLLRGDHKAKFVEVVEEYRTHVEAMRPNYPPWVASKLRGLMASLHVI